MYTKNGSIPKPETDGTDGWIEVPDAPAAPEGKEVVWWCPPGWVVRDPKPAERDGYKWSWSQSEERWVEYALPQAVVSELPTDSLPAMSSTDVVALASEQIQQI